MELPGQMIGWFLSEAEVLGFRIWDVDLTYLCPCCKDYKVLKLPNVSQEEVIELSYLPGQFQSGGYSYFESLQRITTDEQGAYSPEGDWLPAPIPAIEIWDIMKGKATVPNKTLWLAQWFVSHVLERDWTAADFRGQVMAHSKQLLADYSLDEICGCWEAVKDGLFGDLSADYLTFIRKLEPPLVEQFKAYIENPPPVYLETDYAEWKERISKKYGPQADVPLQQTKLWADNG